MSLKIERGSYAGIQSEFIEGVGNDVLLSVTFAVGLVSLAVSLARLWYVTNANRLDDHWPDVLPDEAVPRLATLAAAARDDRGADGDNVGAHTLVGGERSAPDEHTCAICLAALSFPLETNCGHKFCSPCIFAYRQHGAPLAAMRCPMCRQQVTLLLASFAAVAQHTASADMSEADIARANWRRLAADYNRHFSGAPRPMLDYLRDVPTLMRHLWREFFSFGGLVFMFRIRVLVCLMMTVFYLLSPFDILPELFLGLFGLLDDLFVVLLVVVYVSVMYRQYVVGRNN